MNPSLLLIPDRYKAAKLYSQIPDSGAGDLTFARNSSATRVNSAGLIEKVRTNLILNSATFATQTITVGANPHTVSFTGTGTMVITGVATVTLVGTGVNDRVSLSFTTTAGSLILTGTGTITLAQLETGDIATDYIATAGTAVSVGITADIPRLDYTGGGCPSLLLEPQRTNLMTFSEQFDNAAWDKTSGGAAITANSVTSPDGYTNADTITGTGAGVAFILVRQTIAVPSASTYTFSGFFKYNNHPFVTLELAAYDGGGVAFYNIQTGVVSSVSAGTSATITNYGNGWYRCTFTAAIGASDLNGRPSISVAYQDGTIDFPSNAAAAGKAVYAWGCQLEAGSYATSYIPSLGSSVTRLADAASKTGISSLIGQTEGVIFIDFVASAQNQDGAVYSVITIFGDVNDNFQLYTLGGAALRWYAFKAGVIFDQLASQTLVAGQRYKIAYAYKSGDWALYINGVQKSTRTDASIPAVSQFNLNSDAFGAAVAKMENKFNAVAAYPVRLSNSELASLTSL